MNSSLRKNKTFSFDINSKTSIEKAIAEHFKSQNLKEKLSAYRAEYLENTFVELTDFMPYEIWEAAFQELSETFEKEAKRRDLTIKESANTERKMTNVTRDALATHTSVIPAIFESPVLYEFLQEVIGEKVFPTPYRPEEYVASLLHEPNDEHGWHWDDYSWAIIWIFKSPDAGNGGSVQFVPGEACKLQNYDLHEVIEKSVIHTRHPTVGSAYLLRAGDALHRVAPLRYPAERLIICYAFASEWEVNNKEIDHGSMETLYSSN